MLGRDLGDELERLHHPFTFERGGYSERIAFESEFFLQLFDGQHSRDVAFVELDHDRRVVRIEVVLLHVVQEIGEALAVGPDHRRLRVGDEDDRVGALQHQLARLVVEDLSRNGVELDLEVEIGDFADVDWQEVEEERAVGFGGQRQHLPLLAGVELVEDDHQIGRFSAETGTVVNDLRRHLAGGVIEQDHGGAKV